MSKPFNINEALAGKPVRTKDGRIVTKVAYFSETPNSIVCLFVLESPAGYYHEVILSEDLEIMTETKTGIVKLYRSKTGEVYPIFFETEQEAYEWKDTEDNLLTTINVSWEE